MRAVHRRGAVAGAQNAHVEPAVVFTADPVGVQLGRDVAGEAAVRLQGRGGYAYIGDKGDPNQTWNGYAPTNQVFLGAEAMIGRSRSVFRDESGADIATGVNDEGPFADVTQRLFAQRLARRSPM